MARPVDQLIEILRANQINPVGLAQHVPEFVSGVVDLVNRMQMLEHRISMLEANKAQQGMMADRFSGPPVVSSSRR